MRTGVISTRLLYVAMAMLLGVAMVLGGVRPWFAVTPVPHAASVPWLGPPSKWGDQEWQQQQWAGIRAYVKAGCKNPAWQEAHLAACVRLHWQAGTP
jgi:hypothetical protein